MDKFFYEANRKYFQWNSHHFEIVEKLEAIYRGEITKLIINIPPRYGKTELVIKMFSAWCYTKAPTANFLHLSYSMSLVSDNSAIVKDIIASELYQQLFPDVTLSPGTKAKGHWKTEQGGSFYATPAGGSVTGFGAGSMDEVDEDGKFKFSGAILIDDPLKPDDAYSDTMREFINQRWHSTIRSRRNSPATPVIVIMQRIHEHDFCAMLVEKENDWELLKISAVTPAGEALWPAMHSKQDLDAMEKANRYSFSSQYEQNPTVIGGNMFKASYWKFYSALPRIRKRVIYGDTAMKAGEQNDFSVFQCWGTSCDNRLYLIDQLRGKWEAPALNVVAKAFYDKHKAVRNLGILTAFKIEDKASGIGLIQHLKNKGGIPVIGIERIKDKVMRANEVLPQVESGNVFLPVEAPWLSDYLKEFEQFPAGLHDDQVDPTMDAIADTLLGRVVDYGKLL